MSEHNIEMRINKETSHGLKELRDFNNFFGYSGRTVSECIGSNRKLKNAELQQRYPLARAYLEAVKNLTTYLKTYGSGVDIDSYRFRVHHIPAMKEFLDISSRLQFIKALNDQLGVYNDENIGWGIIDIKTHYDQGKLVNTDIMLGDKKLDLSKPVRIHAINWLGKLIDGIQLIDLNAGQTQRILSRDSNGAILQDHKGDAIYEEKSLPVNLAIQVNEDSTSNDDYIEMLAERDGRINKTDMTDTLLFSPLNFLAVRVADDIADEANNVFVTSYETPIFKVLDYSHDIDFVEYSDTLERLHQLKDLDLYYNTREFACLNLFRWGIVDKKSWDRGLEIFRAVDNSPKLWGNDTPVDGRLTQWGFKHIEEIKRKAAKDKGVPVNEVDIDVDNVILSGSYISSLANVLSQSYYKMRALVVDKVKENDVEFRDTYITFRSKPERTNKYQTVSRLNADVYKIIETDVDGNFLRILDPVEVFALLNHNFTAVVVRFQSDLVTADGVAPGEVKPAKEHQDYYNAIGAYKG